MFRTWLQRVASVRCLRFRSSPATMLTMTMSFRQISWMSLLGPVRTSLRSSAKNTVLKLSVSGLVQPSCAGSRGSQSLHSGFRCLILWIIRHCYLREFAIHFLFIKAIVPSEDTNLAICILCELVIAAATPPCCMKWLQAGYEMLKFVHPVVVHRFAVERSPAFTMQTSSLSPSNATMLTCIPLVTNVSLPWGT